MTYNGEARHFEYASLTLATTEDLGIWTEKLQVTQVVAAVSESGWHTQQD